MSLLLVVEHVSGLSLPGCGHGGPCEQAANSLWGKVPLINWPVSFLGLAYFLAALAAWMVTRGAVPGALRQLARLGALASLGFCIILVREWLLCPYCIAAHLGNFAFWITLERMTPRAPRPGYALVSAGVVFVLATAGLGVWDARHRALAAAAAEQDLADATRRIVERSRKPGPVSTKPAVVQSAPAAPTAAHTDQPPMYLSQPFTGRYRLGPEEAPIRIVMITDYQCSDCQRFENEAHALVKGRNDVSLSVKHFPFCRQCNPYVKRDLHPNACWAARAAEATGIMWGNDGFWKMHRWLFDRKGAFETAAELEAGIRQLGYDPQGFAAVMESEEPLRRIRADAKEAMELGLHFTPMVFINGVELKKGWHAANALRRMVEEVAATNPPRRTAAHDWPPRALEKYLADWRDQPAPRMPADTRAWSLGPDDGALEVVMFGDYQDPNTAEADRIVRGFVADRGGVQYTFRHYPLSSDCNPTVKDQRHPHACRASQAAEAAGRLAGDEGYWRMHVWLLEHQAELSDDGLGAAAVEMGLAADALFAAMEQADVRAAVANDIQAGQRLGLRAIPMIFVDGRFVPRWHLNEKPLLGRFLTEAAEE